MPLPIEEIKKLITTSIPDASIEIIDLKGDSNHYSATIESKVFKYEKTNINLDDYRLCIYAYYSNANVKLEFESIE